MEFHIREDSMESTSSSSTSSVFSTIQKVPESPQTNSPPERNKSNNAATNKNSYSSTSRNQRELRALLEDSNKYYSTYEYRMPTSYLKSSSKDKGLNNSDNAETKHKCENISGNDTTNKESFKDDKKSKGKSSKKKIIKKKVSTEKRKYTKHSTVPKKRKYTMKKRLKNKADEDFVQDDNANTISNSLAQSKFQPQHVANNENQKDANIKINKDKESDEDLPTNFIDLYGPRIPVRPNFFDINGILGSNVYNGKPTSSMTLTTHSQNLPQNAHKGVTPEGMIPTVKLQSVLYPNYQEEYKVIFYDRCDIFNPMAEIGKLIEYSVMIYLPTEYSEIAKRDIIPILNTAFDTSNTDLFIETVNNYNKFILGISRKDIVDHLCALTEIPVSFIHDLLHIIYTRSIHPDASKLRHYKAFSNYVYGELLPGFLTDVYGQCNLAPDKLFMDLGSGVGNCVIQAGLEFGCNLSLGCEIMPDASNLTEIQMKEFNERCKLMGLAVPNFEFRLRESFVDNPRIIELLSQCDVMLVNNFLFDSKLNKEVEKLLQHAKTGCKIISLKNLRSFGYTIDFYNIDNILNRLQIKKQKFKENSVSWTHTGGEYYISTVLEEVDESLFAASSRFRKIKKDFKYTR